MHVLTRNSRIWVPVFSLLLCSVPASSQAPLKHITDGVLGHFIGTWSISGTTLGKPTTTGAQIQEDFNGSFLEVHIRDPAGKDWYEARVFFGEKQDGGWWSTGSMGLEQKHLRRSERAALWATK